MAETSVLIVGAGPTGLVLALWLTRLGVRVRIIDKTAEPGTTSRALAVQVRTLEFYQQLGIAAAVIDGGVKLAGINLWVNGERAARVPFGALGEGLTPFPFALVFPQDAHERLLVERLSALGVAVERGTELLSFTEVDGAVRATLRSPNGKEETCTAAYIAGCDGARSAVREQLRIEFPGGTYEQVFYVADVEASGPPADGELHLDLDDADFVIVFPLKGDGRVRLVGAVRGQPGAEGSEPKWSDVQGRAIEHLKLSVKRVNWFSTYHVHHRVAPSFRKGRAFLLGDAAHIHSPVGGQGMNTGIGDAVNLAWKLGDVLKGASSVALLDTYEPERIAFARRLVATTDRVFTFVTHAGPIAQRVRTRLLPFLMPRAFRVPSIREFLFRTLSQTGIAYRDSALSEGAAGHVHGGDRLPWVKIDSTSDNYGSLASLEWQVHVYGDVPAVLRAACEELRMPLHAFRWGSHMEHAGLENGAAYLIRPDGHIALAAASDGDHVLRQYCARWRS